MAERRTQDPDARLDYTWDWSSWLMDDDRIVLAEVTAKLQEEKDKYYIYEPLPKEDVKEVLVEGVTNTDTQVTAWLSGGTADKKYEVVCHIETDDGREDDRTLLLKVKQQ